uniref:ACT domain-containing protein ACR n=1 Tax=Anthurium amnicola TaxID=1678845 RepID=A0A1D1YD71_9ARAE
MGSSGGEGKDDWYAELVQRMHTPSFLVDNDACVNSTIIKVIRVEGMNKQVILLEVVQVLADLNLMITKANMSFDGEWFMDVFHVTDADGNKLQGKKVINKIQESLATKASFLPSVMSSLGVMPSKMLTSIELTGADRPGLLSEVCAVLKDMKCNVVEAEVWTHNKRTAAVVRVTDESSGLAIENTERISTIKELLGNVLRGIDEAMTGKTMVSMGIIHTQRRLHQMLSAERDYERVGLAGSENETFRPHVSVSHCIEKDYSVVTLRSKDRPKLLFDTLCALTDMQYMVFHGTVITKGVEAWQEYYIRHINGSPISSETETKRVIQCLEAAIERRACEGLELELQTEDRIGLLSDITRIFRENGLSIRRAEISTKGGMAIDTFYVSDASGNHVDSKTIDSIHQQITQICKAVLRVKGNPQLSFKPPAETTVFHFGNLLKALFIPEFQVD